MTQRVKFMSKGVMGVMAVALVTMLAAKAEAHSHWLFGKIWYCAPSVCVGLHTEEGPVQSSHIEIAEVLLHEITGEGLCKNGKVDSNLKVPNLVVRKRIEDITHLTDKNGAPIGIGTVVAIFPDAALSGYVQCAEDRSTPSNMLFRQFSVHAKTFACTPSDPINPRTCSVVVGSDFKVTCLLPLEFPGDKPLIIGTLYKCEASEVKQ